MNRAISYISAVIVGLVVGYGIRDIGADLQPSYRWVQVFNKSGCELSSASVLFPDRSIVINSSQFGSSVYPHNAGSDINIPILVSKTQKYRISLDFKECQSRTGELQSFTSGSHIQVWVEKNDIRYGAR